jgi:alkanesulfonate monooxygenase SsuD/methylene tetrahydromethanopterin reductase-like flavin-dependent oxidoreductase (luciferase family)
VGKLEFGVWDQMQTYEVFQAKSAADVYDKHIQQAQLMEKAGFEYYWTLEHQGSYVGAVTSPSVFLTAVARHTEKLRLGTMIWQLPFHNPVRLAEEVAMLDHLSHGRAEFGAGIGVHEHEFIRWGLNYYDRQEMGEETMDIIEMAWSGEPVTYNGRFYKFEDALVQPLPYQQPSIPSGRPCTARGPLSGVPSAATTWPRTSTRTTAWPRSSLTGVGCGGRRGTRALCRGSS